MSLEQSDYTLIDSTIIIHSNVDKQIDLNLFDSKYTRLIFSNYKCVDTCIKYDGEYYFKLANEFDFSKFNQSIELTNNLIHLFFGYNFDYPLNLKNATQLVHLTFGWRFNHPIELTNELIYLCFGDQFDQPIILPNKLTQLFFGCTFNKQIVIPETLTHLSLGTQFNQPIELANVKYLNIRCNSNHVIDYLPNSLKILMIGPDFNIQLDDLPNSIEKIFIQKYYKKKILNIPKNTQIIRHNSFGYLNDFLYVRNMII